MDMRTMAAIAGIGVLAVTTLALQRGLAGEGAPRRLAYALFPASQLLCAAFLYLWIAVLDLPISVTVVVTAIVVACCPIDVFLFRKLKQAQDAEFAEARVKMLADQLTVQGQYNEKLVEDTKNIERVRANVEAELARAVALLGESDAADSHAALEGIQRIMGATMHRFCDNLVIDVVADMKHADCVAAGVRAEFALDVPRMTPAISDVELCAVFANLLDNALKAAEASVPYEGPGAAFVALTSKVRGNVMVASTRNSMPKPDVGDVQGPPASDGAPAASSFKGIEDHGWGLSIVGEIAQRHGGTLVTTTEDGVFCASAMLVFDDAEGEGAQAA